MLGCIQPMSSPMMKRMLGFWLLRGLLANWPGRPSPRDQRPSPADQASLSSVRFHGECLPSVVSGNMRHFAHGSAPLSNDAAETEVACRRVDRLRVARRRPVAAAVVRRAQMRAALDDLAGNSCSPAGEGRSCLPRVRRADSPECSTPSAHRPGALASTSRWSIPRHCRSCRGGRSRSAETP